MTTTLAILGILAPTVAVLVNTFLSHWDRRRIKRNLESQDVQIGEIHVLVNNRLTLALERIAALTAELARNTASPKHRREADAAAADLAALTDAPGLYRGIRPT